MGKQGEKIFLEHHRKKPKNSPNLLSPLIWIKHISKDNWHFATSQPNL